MTLRLGARRGVGLATAVALALSGASALAADVGSSRVGAGTHWQRTTVPQPTAASAAGGVSLHVVRGSQGARCDVARYDTGSPADVTRHVRVPCRGRLVHTFIDRRGTAVLIATDYRSRRVSSLLWRRGEARPHWSAIASGDDYGDLPRFKAATDNAGDLALLIMRGSGDDGYIVYRPSSGWSAPRAISSTGVGGAVRDLDLSADGQIVAIATADSDTNPVTTTTSLLWRPIFGDGWARHQVVVDGGTLVRFAFLDAGRGRSAAFDLYLDGYSLLLGVASGPGDVSTRVRPDAVEATVWRLRDDGPGSARFIVRDFDSPGGQVTRFIQYDGTWGESDRRLDLEAGGSGGEFNDDGTLLYVWSVPDKHRVVALMWDVGADLGRPSIIKTKRALIVMEARELDSGASWISTRPLTEHGGLPQLYLTRR